MRVAICAVSLFQAKCGLPLVPDIVGILDNYFGNPASDSLESIFYLGEHSVRHSSVGFHPFEIFRSDFRNQAAVIVPVEQDPVLFKTEDQFRFSCGSQADGYTRCHGISVGVEQSAIAVDDGSLITFFISQHLDTMACLLFVEDYALSIGIPGIEQFHNLRIFAGAKIRLIMYIGLLSDTHGIFDEPFRQFFGPVDEIWHAGDFGSIAVADAISAFKPLKGVFGNCDGNDIRLDYPGYQLFMCENMKVLMTHIGGYPGRYDPRARALIDEFRPDIFVCGHSHILKVVNDRKRNMLVINPGAAGLQGFHIVRTALRFRIENTEIKDMEVFELPRTNMK